MTNPLKSVVRKAGNITVMAGLGGMIGGALDAVLDTDGKCTAIGTLMGAGLGAITPEDQEESECVYVQAEDPSHYQEYGNEA